MLSAQREDGAVINDPPNIDDAPNIDDSTLHQRSSEIGKRLGASGESSVEHRWAWFAEGDREWRTGFESYLHERLTGLPASPEAQYEITEHLTDALWGHGGSLAELKARAKQHCETLGLDRAKCHQPPPALPPTHRFRLVLDAPRP